MARRGSPARRKSTTSAWLLWLGFSLLRHVVIGRKARRSHTAVSQRHRLLWARSRRTAAVFTAAVAASYTATVAASVRPEGGRTQDLTFDLPVSSQMPLSRSSFSPSAVTSCSRVKRQGFVSPPDLSALTLTLSLAHSLSLPPLSFLASVALRHGHSCVSLSTKTPLGGE